MTELTCRDCKHAKSVVIGISECSFALDGFLDVTRLECRRFPPRAGFFGSDFPSAKAICGEFIDLRAISAFVRGQEK